MPKKLRYRPNQNETFPLSRSKVEQFLKCPRCFYLSTIERYDIPTPSGPMSYIPTALDEILKNSHDIYRERQEPTPYMTDRGIEAVPFQHEKMKDWRHKNKGIRYLHETTNLELYGAIDDVWKSRHNDELFLVDYKSTTVRRKKGKICIVDYCELLEDGLRCGYACLKTDDNTFSEHLKNQKALKTR